MNEILAIIFLPIAAGLLLFFIPEKFRTAKGILALIISIIAGYISVIMYRPGFEPGTVAGFSKGTPLYIFGIEVLKDVGRYALFVTDNLSKLILVFISLFIVLVLVYSLTYARNGQGKNSFAYFLITAGCSYGVALSDNLLLFLTFWGILGMTLYKLIPGKDEESSAAAKKTLILIGASDTIMVIGIAIVWKLAGTLNMSQITLSANNPLTITAFLALLVGSFTKAGAFPFHTWVPDYAKNAPASSSALLPASLDKLLGIYFLARITQFIVLNDGLRILMLSVGVITIITAVMMALTQHDYKRLLGFHAVSQVGYMIIGFSLGSVIGFAAGLFHMLNNALYKSGLFLSSGCVEYRTGKSSLDDLGGLSKAMPVTFIASLIFAVSISGIPPFNGFASKWMIYQSIIDFGAGSGLANKMWIVWLGFAVAGSALTLASFIKLIGGIFLGRQRKEFESVREVPVLMWLPVAVLAVFCVVFGIFATNIVVPRLLMPVSGGFEFSGLWNSGLVSLMVLVSIALGIIVYLATGTRKLRTEDSFIGGEKIQDETGYPTPEFYKTLTEIGFFSWMYRKAEKKWFDIYDQSKSFVLWLSHQFSDAHTGILPVYVLWAFAGLIIMLLIMI
ncbi:MAG: proton-conducting transporter membrane subunit [Bacteroidales bacterium]